MRQMGGIGGGASCLWMTLLESQRIHSRFGQRNFEKGGMKSVPKSGVLRGVHRGEESGVGDDGCHALKKKIRKSSNWNVNTGGSDPIGKHSIGGRGDTALLDRGRLGLSIPAHLATTLMGHGGEGMVAVERCL